MRDVLTSNFNHAQETVHVVQTGSYKKKDKSIGWEVEKGFSVPRLGGWKFNVEFVNKKYVVSAVELN